MRHANRARAGDEMRQVALLAIGTIGFSSAMAAYSWIGDIVDRYESSRPVSSFRANSSVLWRISALSMIARRRLAHIPAVCW